MWSNSPGTEGIDHALDAPATHLNTQQNIPAGVRSLTIGIAALAMAGCAGSGNYPSSPHERNLSIDRDGMVRYSPSHYPDYREPSTDPRLERTLGGIWIWMLLCKIWGASWWLALGCGGAGGLLAYSTYDVKEVEARDLHALRRQLVHAYRSGGLSAENRPSNPYITRHVSIGREWMIQGKYHVRFTVQEVNTNGRLVQKYSVQAILVSKEWQFEFTNPVLFPWEKNMAR